MKKYDLKIVGVLVIVLVLFLVGCEERQPAGADYKTHPGNVIIDDGSSQADDISTIGDEVVEYVNDPSDDVDIAGLSAKEAFAKLTVSKPEQATVEYGIVTMIVVNETPLEMIEAGKLVIDGDREATFSAITNEQASVQTRQYVEGDSLIDCGNLGQGWECYSWTLQDEDLIDTEEEILADLEGIEVARLEDQVVAGVPAVCFGMTDSLTFNFEQCFSPEGVVILQFEEREALASQRGALNYKLEVDPQDFVPPVEPVSGEEMLMQLDAEMEQESV